MYFYHFNVVLQEVPGEISLCFSISGCKLQCYGCHSSFMWKEETGALLTKELFISKLIQYKNLATCVLFMGGEWHKKELLKMLQEARTRNYKTCLYTGEVDVSAEIRKELTWLKTGPWKQELGGLESKKTNQLFKRIKTNQNQNYLFHKN